MDLEDEDQHICLSCHTLVAGLQNYINHRKNECPNRKTVAGKENHATNSSIHQSPENQQHRASGSFPVPVTSQQNSGAVENVSVSENQDVILNSINDVNQVTDSHNASSQQQRNGFMSQSQSENITRGDSVVTLPMDINCSSSLDVSSALSPTTNRIVDPNMVLIEGEKHFSDFFSSLELQSRNSNLDGVKSQMLSEPMYPKASLDLENGSTDFLGVNQSPSDLDTTLRIANILNELGFSSESEDEFGNCNYNVDFLDDSGDDSHPPSNFTGGKWKPGTRPSSRSQRNSWKDANFSPPENHTRGKWKPGSSPLQHQHGGKWKRESSPPPENHTHGKWKPGRGPPQGYQGGKWKPDLSDSENELEENTVDNKAGEVLEDVMASPDSKLVDDKHDGAGNSTRGNQNEEDSMKSLHCQVCNRTLLTQKSYEHHMQTKLHRSRCKERDTPQALPPVIESIDCPICDKTFNNKYNFARHLVSTIHKKAAREQGRDLMLVEKYQVLVSRLSPYQCQVCSFYCNNNDDLFTHMLSDDHCSKVKTLIGPMLCVRCRYIAEDNADMLKHLQSEEHDASVLQTKRPCVIKENRYKLRCKLCDKVFHSAKRLLVHMQTKHRIKVLGQQMSRDCPQCGKHFKTIFAMTLHVRRRHTKERPFRCEKCNVGFSDSYTLKLHEKSKRHMDILIGNKQQNVSPTTKGKPPLGSKKHSRGVFKCDHCSFKTKRYGDLRPHYLLAHANQMYRCDICGIAYCFEKNLVTHMKSSSHQKAVKQAQSSSEEALSCMVCFQKFYNAKQLRLHELTHQAKASASTQKGQVKVSQTKTNSRFKSFLQSLPKGYKKATCPECGKTVSRQNLVPHLRLHENDKVFECPICNHSYASLQTLRKHMKMHLGIKDYVCKICGKEFYKASSYVVHQMRHDKTAPRSFKCDQCDSAFYRRWELSRHMKIHTSKNIKCPFPGCRLLFANHSEYRTHERTHTGERPYLCDECGYAGKTQQQLSRHRRTHTGERNFSCEYCTYKASNSTHLRRHMRIHIGSKPYKCPYCEYRCNTHENIRKHITKTKKHVGLKIYPCKECKFGSNDIKEFKEHMLTEHPSVYNSENPVMSAFAGLYDSENDPREVPEGSQAWPVKEKGIHTNQNPKKAMVADEFAQVRNFESSHSMKEVKPRMNQPVSLVYEDHTYSTDDDFMRHFMKTEEITVEIIHDPTVEMINNSSAHVWSSNQILPSYSVPHHAAEVIIDPSSYVPIRTDLKPEFLVPQPGIR